MYPAASNLLCNANANQTGVRPIPGDSSMLHCSEQLQQVLHLGGGLPHPLTPARPPSRLCSLTLAPGLPQGRSSEDLRR